MLGWEWPVGCPSQTQVLSLSSSYAILLCKHFNQVSGPMDVCGLLGPFLQCGPQAWQQLHIITTYYNHPKSRKKYQTMPKKIGLFHFVPICPQGCLYEYIFAQKDAYKWCANLCYYIHSHNLLSAILRVSTIGSHPASEARDWLLETSKETSHSVPFQVGRGQECGGALREGYANSPKRKQTI